MRRGALTITPCTLEEDRGREPVVGRGRVQHRSANVVHLMEGAPKPSQWSGSAH
jgi:hypothetical protein